MKKSKVLRIIGEAVQLLAPVAPGELFLEPEQSIFESSTQHEIDGKCSGFHIGVKELGGDANSEIDDFETMTVIVSIFHEVCGHGGQIKYERNKTGPLSKAIISNFYACKASPYYYNGGKSGFSKEYSLQCHEVAAQYMGIKTCYEFLMKSDNIESFRVPELVMDYVEKRAAMGSEFISEGIEINTMDDIYDAFNESFQKRVHAHHPYSVKKAGNDRLTNNRFKRLFMFPRLAVEAVQHHPDGMVQDLIMLSAGMEDWDPNHHFRKLPVFDGMDFSMGHPVRPELPNPKDHGLDELESMLPEAYVEQARRKRLAERVGECLEPGG